MRYHERGGVTVGNDVLHTFLTFFTEITVTDGEDLVKDYHIRLDHARDGKRDAGFHAGGQSAEGVILKFTHIGKIDYFLVLAVDKLLGVAQKRTAQINILLNGHILVEACAQFEQSAQLALFFDCAGGGTQRAAYGFHHCGFACTVLADDTQHIALFEAEGYVLQRPEFVVSCLLAEKSSEYIRSRSGISFAVSDGYIVKYQNLVILHGAPP